MSANSHPNTIEAIAFDFDGTLVDSFDVFVHGIEYALNRPPFTPEEIQDLRQYSMREVIEILRVKKWQLPWLVVKGMREIDRHADETSVFEGMPEVVKELSTAGHKLFIVSSHSAQGIDVLLERYELNDYFEHIYANVGLWGKSKGLRKIQQQYGYAPEQCAFVGDEVRDIEAAAKANVACIAVEWGFNTAEALKAHEPAALVARPDQLVDAIKSLS